jgi:hypothetical protein
MVSLLDDAMVLTVINEVKAVTSQRFMTWRTFFQYGPLQGGVGVGKHFDSLCLLPLDLKGTSTLRVFLQFRSFGLLAGSLQGRISR